MKKRLREALLGVLPQESLSHVSNSYDVVGDIAIIRLTAESERCRRNVAEALMKAHRNVRTVLAQTSPVHGEFRTRKLEHVAGEDKKSTIHLESGCKFFVDVEKCYFSPRLSYERMRVSRLVKHDEVVVNMFAGVGCFSLIIAKYSSASRVYSIDVNPEAVQLMRENVRLNRAYGKVIPILGDAKEVVEGRLHCSASRILMPLPEKALEFLPHAVSALTGSRGWIHYYGFEHAGKNESPIEKVKLKVARKLGSMGVDFEIPFIRVVRSTGPNWFQVVLDVLVNR